MRKVRIAQATMVFCVSAGLVIAIPSFFRYITGNPSSKPGVILVNGRIEGTEVAIGSKLPARVLKVNVREGQQVKKGDVLVELDASEILATYEESQAQISRAKHSLENAKEQVIRSQEQLAKAKIALELVKQQIDLNILQAESAVSEAQAGVDQAKALANKAKTQYEHSAKLRQEDAASDLEYTYARDALDAQNAAVRMAEQKLAQARQALKLAQANKSQIKIKQHDIAVMESAVRQAKSTVGIAQAGLQAAKSAAKILQIKLKDAKILAPSDGVVVSRIVEPGEIVGMGSTVMVIVNFDKLYLKGYLPNNQISKIKLNAPARIYVDAFGDKYFNAKVTKINQRAEFTPKTVDTPQQRVKLVFGLELKVDNSDRLLKPGMPADAIIKTDSSAKWCKPADLR